MIDLPPGVINILLGSIFTLFLLKKSSVIASRNSKIPFEEV